METITIDEMDEHDFRHSIEDMLRSDNVDEAIEKLRQLLEPYAGVGKILPPRFLDVSASAVEFAGWHKLAERLRDHDRRGHPVSAIGVVLADARTLGGPGPSGGWLAPFIKTFYFSDDAYPFTDATRDDLLDGYSREGFGWQGDYQATDATLSIKGIDDLYGAIVELEDRLFTNQNPTEAEIRAGSIGACYLAVLIHQSLRETIRKKGLPRPLCVLAACDGVYPFFDAPVSGYEEFAAEVPPEEVWPNELEGATQGDEEDCEEDIPAEASLLTVVTRPRTKKAVIVLGEEDAKEASQYTEMAAAQRMIVDDETALKGVLQGLPAAELGDADWFDAWDETEGAPAEIDFANDSRNGPGDFSDLAQETEAADEEAIPEAKDWTDAGSYESLDLPELGPDDPAEMGEAPAGEPFAPPPRHSLRSRINLAQPEASGVERVRIGAIVDWLKRLIFRR